MTMRRSANQAGLGLMSLIQHTDFTPVDASKRQISPNGPLSTRTRSGRVADLTDIRGRTGKRETAD
jgi:hypothetical protein